MGQVGREYYLIREQQLNRKEEHEDDDRFIDKVKINTLSFKRRDAYHNLIYGLFDNNSESYSQREAPCLWSD